MQPALVQITKPAVPVVAGEEAARRLGLDIAVAPLLVPMLAAAEQTLDGPAGLLGRALVSQQWEMYFTDSTFPGGAITIPLPPLLSVDSLECEDGSGEFLVVDPQNYKIWPGEPAKILPNGWRIPPFSCLRLRFTCGYGPAGTDVPEPIRQAIVMKAAFQRSMSRDDPQLRSETVDGVGTQTWAVSDVVGTAYEKAALALVSGYRMPVL